uniref:Tripeptidyl-peptidase II first Ig-like domain-containing protein n=1 Tax=Timema bartmani TaxID=61472 RepID=A0A7R9EYJ8_9NEOP|nr:unnamed protein product [Timema bartmani]
MSDGLDSAAIEAEPKNKIIFGMKLTLDCRDSWVQCPTHLDISNISRGFIVKINPMHLPTGLHHTSIDAFDVACVNKGAVFRVPITVCHLFDSSYEWIEDINCDLDGGTIIVDREWLEINQ